MKTCSNPDCKSKGALLPYTDFYTWFNNAKGRQCYSSHCRECERQRRKKYLAGSVKGRKNYSPAPQGDQIWINDVMKISLVKRY